MLDIAVIGGGAAGFFSAINCKQKHPNLKIAIFEKSKNVLSKVRISGGGRCNVTHACFDNRTLVSYYPRGKKELVGVFNIFNPSDTIEWFKKNNVHLKTESDGRIFPVSNNSETIIKCFIDKCRQLDIPINTSAALQNIKPQKDYFELSIGGEIIKCKKVIIATGSSEYIWSMLQELGHTIVSPVASLFSFNIKHPLLSNTMGTSFENVLVRLDINNINLTKEESEQMGAMLITHWGLSGPAILKLSSVAARILYKMNYRFSIRINFVGNVKADIIYEELLLLKKENTRKQVTQTPLPLLTNKFWRALCEFCNLGNITWAEVKNIALRELAETICNCKMQVSGKSTNKDEFVTAGGVELKEINFKTMQSKIIPNLYLAGEILNIDALTGGFNFQAAWSESWIISENINN